MFITKKSAYNESGSSAVEFAVVMPVLLLFLLGIVVYGLYVGASHSVAQLAADAARASVAGLSDAERTAIAHDVVTGSASAYPLLAPDKLSVAAARDEADETRFRVVVTYQADDLPIWGLSSLVPLPSRRIERAATIKHGGY